MGRLSDYFSPLSFCFLNVVMRWMFIRLSPYNFSWLASSMHLLHVFLSQKLFNLTHYCHMQTGLWWFHLFLTTFNCVIKWLCDASDACWKVNGEFYLNVLNGDCLILGIACIALHNTWISVSDQCKPRWNIHVRDFGLIGNPTKRSEDTTESNLNRM